MKDVLPAQFFQKGTELPVHIHRGALFVQSQYCDADCIEGSTVHNLTRGRHEFVHRSDNAIEGNLVVLDDAAVCFVGYNGDDLPERVTCGSYRPDLPSITQLPQPIIKA